MIALLRAVIIYGFAKGFSSGGSGDGSDLPPFTPVGFDAKRRGAKVGDGVLRPVISRSVEPDLRFPFHATVQADLHVLAASLARPAPVVIEQALHDLEPSSSDANRHSLESAIKRRWQLININLQI
jgi:hypothetical protein